MALPIHRQPFKAIYLIGFFIVLLFIHLPFWFIYYSWRPNRPKKSWTLRRTVAVQIMRKMAWFPITLGALDARDLTLEVPQKDLESLNARFLWIPELEKEDIVGLVEEHATRTGTKSIAIPAYWILKEGAKWSPAHDKAQKDEKVVLYFHGGAFLTGTAHPSHLTASFVRGILKHSASLSRLLSVDYRLSAGPPFEPRNPFPAAVIDAIAAYKYLVCEVGFLPQNITVGGDSAGGNLALAVTRYVVESRLSHLPPPGGLFAASPWVDMSFSRATIDSSYYLNAKSDIFSSPPNTRLIPANNAAIRAYIGELDPEETKYNRYISPASKFVLPPNVDEGTKPFSGFPRSYITGGGAEISFDDIVTLTERMKDDGVDITTDFPPDAIHAYPIFVWHEPERTESIIKCAAWLDECQVATVVTEHPLKPQDTLV